MRLYALRRFYMLQKKSFYTFPNVFVHLQAMRCDTLHIHVLVFEKDEKKEIQFALPTMYAVHKNRNSHGQFLHTMNQNNAFQNA